MAAMTMADDRIQTRWLKPGFALEIINIDLPLATPGDLDAFADICRKTPVVVLRNQKLDARQCLEIASHLGRVSAQHRTGPHPEFPGISILSNKKVDGKLIGVRDAGRNWHTDGTTYETLGLRTMLYGVECPPVGSDTLLADAAAAFDALPVERQKELEKINVVHNRATLISKYSRSLLQPEDIEKMKDVVHPMVVRSQIDGRKALFLTNGSTKSVEGMPDEEGWALVKDLIGWCTQEKFVYAHKWQDRDVLIWNNVGTMHCATTYEEEKYDRLVYRMWMRPTDLLNKTSDVEDMMSMH